MLELDPLSDILSLLKPRGYMCGGIEAGGDWSVAFPANEYVKCYVVVEGELWLAVDGVPDPVRLQPGDCFLLPLGRGFRMTNDLALKPVPFKELVKAPLEGGIVTFGTGGEFFGVGGVFGLSGEHAGMLLAQLPAIVHIREESDRAELRWAIERMMKELRDPKPGGSLVAEHLASLMLVHALRNYVSEGLAGGVGWLFALADREMRAAIGLMHGEPARRWTLEELAARVGMSRSSFSSKFKATVGTSPMEYLTRWRMHLAGDRLATSADPVSAIAELLGYDSESAFSAAFKRVMNCSPRQYGRRNRMRPEPHERDLAFAD